MDYKALYEQSQKKLSETIKSNEETEKELVAQRHDAEHLQGLVQSENDHLIDENKQLKAELQHAIGAVAEQPPIAEMSAEDALDLAVNTIEKRLTIAAHHKVAELEAENDHLLDENRQLKTSYSTYQKKSVEWELQNNTLVDYMTGNWKLFKTIEESIRDRYTQEFIDANKEAFNKYGLFE